MSTIYIPYVYHLFHKPTNKHYYGSEYSNNKKTANPENLWKTYFTTSNIIKKLIKEYGADSFEKEIRKIFKTAEEAVSWESRFLVKIDAKNNDLWLNQHNGNGKFRNKGGYNLSDKTIEKMKLYWKHIKGSKCIKYLLQTDFPRSSR